MNEKNTKSKGWLYILIALLLLVIIVLVILLVKASGKGDNNSTTIEQINENENDAEHKSDNETQDNTEHKTKNETEDKTENEIENKTEPEAGNKEENDTASKLDFDYETLGIKAYEYPSAFSMGDNLNAAIVELATNYDDFDENVVKNENWKESFISNFIQNSRFSFDYLNQIDNENNGEIGIHELNYIQYSLTNIDVDFSSFVKDSVDCHDAASGMNYGFITDYTSELTDEGVCITANLEIGFDGVDYTRKYELTVNLIKNPYSCFDGYSIDSLTSKEIVSQIEQDDKVHTFYGNDMEYEEDGVFLLEVTSAEDGMNYAHFVSADLTESPELADLVRKNPGCYFKVDYILQGGETDPIDRVVPIDVVLAE